MLPGRRALRRRCIFLRHKNFRHRIIIYRDSETFIGGIIKWCHHKSLRSYAMHQTGGFSTVYLLVVRKSICKPVSHTSMLALSVLDLSGSEVERKGFYHLCLDEVSYLGLTTLHAICQVNLRGVLLRATNSRITLILIHEKPDPLAYLP